jgi:hypothetical protein
MAEPMLFAASGAEIHREKMRMQATRSRLTRAVVAWGRLTLDMVVLTSNPIGRFLLAESVLRNVPYSGGK